MAESAQSMKVGAYAAGVALALVVSAIPAGPATAQTYATTPVGAGAESAAAIASAAKAYETARTSYVQSGALAFSLQKRGEILQGLLPAQRERRDEAARQLYKLEQRPFQVVEMLLEADSLDDFVAQREYLDRITQANMAEIRRTNELAGQIEQNSEAVEKARSRSQAQLEAASRALEAAYEAREQKQREGIANSQAQAAALGGDSSVGKDGEGKDQPEDFRVAASTEAAALDDRVNWRVTEEEFVAEWAPRLDAYLAGSPLYGQGKNFAKSAYKYCIDPRWSAAISNTESSKGRVCIRPHNAWGWGAADSDPYNLALEWSSWEAAIDTHAKGLAEGYGYTISITGAQAYCPYTWQSWYNNTLGEMARI